MQLFILLKFTPFKTRKKRTYGLVSVNFAEAEKYFKLLFIFYILAYRGIIEVCKNSNQLVVKESTCRQGIT